MDQENKKHTQSEELKNSLLKGGVKVNTNDKTCELCLKEMFKRVGMKYPDKKFTDQPNWYWLKTWTPKEEDDFKKWMDKLLKKRHKNWDKKSREREIAMFNLMWGWKNEPKRH